jgi:hypothetical protein
MSRRLALVVNRAWPREPSDYSETNMVIGGRPQHGLPERWIVSVPRRT